MLRATFIVVLCLAIVASGVGLYGVVRYDEGDLREARSQLPSDGLAMAAIKLAILPMQALEEMDAAKQGEDASAALAERRRLERRLATLGQLQRFRRAPDLSQEVRDGTDHICPEEVPEDPQECLDALVQTIRRMRARRAETRRPFELTLYVGLGTWPVVLVLGIILWRRRRKLRR